MTEPDGQNRKPASKCVWYILATVAGEPQSLQEFKLMSKNASFWNCLMSERATTYGGMMEDSLGPELDRPDYMPSYQTLTDENMKRIQLALDTRGFKNEPIPDVNDPIDFSNVDFTQLTSFSGFVFRGQTRFDNAKFRHGPVLFKGATFAGNVSFEGVTFCTKALFPKTRYEGGASFKNTRFLSEANFGHAKFRRADFVSAEFAGDVTFVSAEFVGDVTFANTIFARQVNFHSAGFGRPTRFQEARFETRVPAFFGATLHEYTDWHGAIWPSVPDDANEAGEQVHSYQRLALLMNKLEKPDARRLFFRLEMRARRRAEGWSITSVVNSLYRLACDYGHGLTRISVFWFGHLVIGAVLICVARIIGSSQNGLSRETAYEFMCNLPQAFAISFSNAHVFFRLSRGFLQNTIKDWAGVPFFNLIGGVQTVVGTVLLFFLLLTIRNRFRMR